MTARRFPPPWSIEEGQTWFVVKDNGGQKLAYVHFDDPRSAAKLLTRDEVWRIAPNVGEASDQSCCHKSEAPSKMPLGAAELLPQLRLLSGGGVSGDGMPPGSA